MVWWDHGLELFVLMLIVNSIAVLQLPRTVPVINENALADEASKKDAHGPADGPEAEREEPRAS